MQYQFVLICFQHTVPALLSWRPPPPKYKREAPCLIYNEGLGAEPQRGPGAEPEVESFLALECPTKAAKFAVLDYMSVIIN